MKTMQMSAIGLTLAAITLLPLAANANDATQVSSSKK